MDSRATELVAVKDGKDRPESGATLTPDQHKALLVLSKLVAYILSSIMKTEAEWRDWGKPFMLTSFIAQFGETEGKKLANQYDEQFYPLIKERLAFLFEPEKSCFHTSGTGSGFMLLSFAQDRLYEDLSKVAAEDSVDLEDTVKLYLHNYFRYVTQSKNYDARGRLAAQRVCLLLNIAAEEFSAQEQAALKAETDSTSFNTQFKATSEKIPKSSVLTPYRVLKVALVAIGGGAVVGMTSFVSAPALYTTLIPLLTSASEIFQVSVTFQVILQSMGLLPYVMGTYGGSYASYLMMQRTASLPSFSLAPLYNPHTSQPFSHSTPQSEPLSVSALPPTVCILIAGLVDKGGEHKEVWGGDGVSMLPEVAEGEKMKTKMASDGDTAETMKQRAVVGDAKAASRLLHKGEEIASIVLKKTAELGHPIICSAAAASVMAAAVSFVEGEATKLQQDGGLVDLGGLPEAAALQRMEDLEEVEGDWEAVCVTCRRGWYRDVLPSSEAYLLHWGAEKLLPELGGDLTSLLSKELYDTIYGKVKSYFYAYSPLSPLSRAFSLPLSVVKQLKTIVDPWSVVMERTRQGGVLLAKTLLEMKRGALSGAGAGGVFRPVNLIGYGMGARVIFHCLQKLAEEGGQDAYGLVENAVLMGAPVTSSPLVWAKLRPLVAHRMVNCYSPQDYVLALLYRYKALDMRVAGIGPVFISDGKGAGAKDIGVHSEKAPWRGCVKVEIEGGESQPDSALDTGGIIELPDDEAEGFQVNPQYLYSPPLVDEVENIDVSAYVKCHNDYPHALKDILTLVQLQ